MAKPFVPEPKVFMTPVTGPGEYQARYDRLFRDAGAATERGEKTSYYLESEEACTWIHQILGTVRLVFILREPVARAYSNYLWSRMNGLETLSFEEAIKLEGHRPSPLPREKAYARPFDYLTRGDYATFAERYLKVFGKDALCFLLYEDLVEDPDGFMRKAQNFIGVSPLPAEKLGVEMVNVARDSGPPIDPRTEELLRRRMAKHVERTANVTGLDVGRWGYGH